MSPEITLDMVCPDHRRPLRDCHPVPFAGISMADYLAICGAWPATACVRAATRTGGAA